MLVVVLVWGGLPAHAQDDWYSFLYNWENNDLVQVSTSGTVVTHNLGLSENVFFSSQDLALTADGSRIAFCAVDYSGAAPRATLYLRHLSSNTNLLEIDFGTAIGCKVTPDAFNADETRLAVGLVNHYGAEDPTLDTSKPLWQLRVIDVASGATVSELNAESAVVAASGMLLEAAIMPEVRRFEGDAIIFAEVPYGLGGTPTVSAYTWQVSSGTVNLLPDGPWGHFGVDQLESTGETAWVAHNPVLPAAPTNGALGFANVIMLGDSSGQERMIYHSADWTIIDVRFIDDGQRLAILLFPAFDANQAVGEEPTRWVALDRAGNVSDLQVNMEFGGGVASAPGGYVYLSMGYLPGQPESALFTLEWYQNGQRSELWSAEGLAWEIVWTAPPSAPADLPPFPDFVLAS